MDKLTGKLTDNEILIAGIIVGMAIMLVIDFIFYLIIMPIL